MSAPLVMLLLGAPGAGKGTYCKEITARYGTPQISTGDMFRLAVKEGTEVGKKAQGYMDRGALVPDDVVLGVVRDRFLHPDCRERGFILDGFPRTLSQAEALPAMLQGIGLHLCLAVNLDVQREVLIKRLTGRRMCRGCARGNFNVFTLPPKQPGVCDYCGGELFQRDDDKIEVIENRLKVYGDQTQPLIEHYRAKGMLHNLPFEGDIAQMSARIFALTDAHLKTHTAAP